MHKVSECEHTDKRRCRRKQKDCKNEQKKREQNFFCFANCAQLVHTDQAFFLCRKRFHNRRLNHRNESHVRIRSNCNNSHHLRSKLAGNIDCRRTVRTADNCDCTCLKNVIVNSRNQVHKRNAEHGKEDTELCSTAKKCCLGIGDKRTEVCHSADSHKDKHREEFISDAGAVNNMQHAVRSVTHSCSRNVYEDCAESNRYEEQRLKVFNSSKIDDKESNEKHNKLLPARSSFSRERVIFFCCKLMSCLCFFLCNFFSSVMMEHFVNARRFAYILKKSWN